ncbi:hypothetical protein V5O48_009233 [Marasmius crinis-equi]|uniref:Uncharacterized protein n=1 Tax=Marasmius crinis-equi TaxID=585013 RepID=A0ABR3FC15_9AGAR
MSKSRNQTANEGWGSRSNFQYSHGLKMTPDDIDEGNEILDQYREYDRGGEQHDQGYASDGGYRECYESDDSDASENEGPAEQEYRHAEYDSDQQQDQGTYESGEDSDYVSSDSDGDAPPQSDGFDEYERSDEDDAGRYSDDGGGYSDPASDGYDDDDDDYNDSD